MGKINWERVFLGGAWAGLVLILLKSASWVLFGGKVWRSTFEAFGLPTQMTVRFAVFWIIMFFVLGISAVWFYAAIRPRYGAGPKTAICAGMAIWFLAALLPEFVFNAMGALPLRLVLIDVGTYFVLIVAATLVGAWQYKE
jgi:hypothetical protein